MCFAEFNVRVLNFFAAFFLLFVEFDLRVLCSSVWVLRDGFGVFDCSVRLFHG